MNLHRWLTTLSTILTLAACAQVTADQGQAPYPLGNSGEYPRDRGGDGGEVVEAEACSGSENRTSAGVVTSRPVTYLGNAARALQTVSAPLFDHYIPMLKAGAVLKNVNDFLLANPHLDLQNRNGADYKLAVDQVRKIANTVDNRLGEMISDHLFMNKTLQQSAQVGMRSFS